MEISGVAAGQLSIARARAWPFIEHFAGRDLDGMTAAELWKDLEAKLSQLWIIGDFQAVAITRVTREAVRIERCAGVRRKEWQEHFDEEIKAWAKALGKRRVIGTVRPGWAGFGKSRGYREKHREMVFEVE